MIELLAAASGTAGMAGGQALDLGAIGRELSVAEIEEMHTRKTGALIRASVLMAAATAPSLGARQLAMLDAFAATSASPSRSRTTSSMWREIRTTLGKPTGADRAKNKPTYPSVVGHAGRQARCLELHASAVAALADFGPGADELRWLADFVVARDN